MARQKQARIVKQMTAEQFESLFPDEEACKAYLTARRWPEGVRCPRCDNPEIYDHSSYASYHWQCRQCDPQGYRFSVLVGTVFENTNKPLKTWFRVIHRMLTSKKGVSALELYRTLSDIGSYKTAWYMCHRVRAGLQDESFRKLVGIVEIDETWIGGKAKNKHGGHDQQGRGPKGKTPVIGAVQRKGNVVARVLSVVSQYTVQSFLNETVSDRVSLLATDHAGYYHGLEGFPLRAAVDHKAKQYVIGAVHTNTIEGFWSQFKRGIVGSFHKVSKKYLPLYVAEFQFRYNNRHNPDIFGTAIKTC